MTFHLPPWLLRLWITAICSGLVAVAVADRAVPQPSDARRPLTADLRPSDALPVPAPNAPPPEVLVAWSSSGRSVLSPTPTPVPPLTRSWPDWVRSLRDTFLSPSEAKFAPDGPRKVPEGSDLRVIRAQGSLLKVFYGGDGDELESAEGWVNRADVSPSRAPKWVLALRPTALRSTSAPGARTFGWLPEGAVLEVLEDSTEGPHVFYPGDTRTREALAGWADVADLAAAGALLAGESRGVRLLGRSGVESLKSGDGLWLKVPHRTQLDGSLSSRANCGPVSVGMVLEFFGLFAPTGELRTLANRLQGTWDPDSGVAIEHLQGIIQRFGLRGHDLYSGTGFRRWNLDDVRRHLSQGHPVIPELRYRLIPGRGDSETWADHYVVLSGMLGDDFIYNDAIDADGPGFGRLMSSESLLRAWSRSDFPYAAFAVSRP